MVEILPDNRKEYSMTGYQQVELLYRELDGEDDDSGEGHAHPHVPDLDGQVRQLSLQKKLSCDHSIAELELPRGAANHIISSTFILMFANSNML
jgi:hypothetical protein